MCTTNEVDVPLSIKVLLDTLEQSSGRLITGVISISLRQHVFPDSAWSDFVVTVLSWWLSSAYNLASHRDETVICRFMDGPFGFSMELMREDCWHIKLFRDISGSNLIAESLVDPKLVLHELLSAADKVLTACKAKNWLSDDIKELESQYTRLRQLAIGPSRGGG
jgi:hypothetical protein